MTTNQTNPEVAPLEEPNLESKTLGLLGAMKDGWVSQFEYRGFIVRQVGASIEFCTEHEEPLGGYLLMKSATVASAYEWLEAKADYYGDNQ